MNAEQFVQFISEAATLNTPPSNPFRELGRNQKGDKTAFLW